MTACNRIISAVVLAASVEVTRIAAMPQERPTFRSGVVSIEVDVRVTDRTGGAIPNLTKDDFTLLDDGVPQTISTVSFVDLLLSSPISRIAANSVEADIATNTGSGRMWVMLLGGLSREGSLVARRVARQFIESSLGPHDEVAVVSLFGTMSNAQAFTRNRQRMLSAVDRLQDDRSSAPGDAGLVAYQVLEDLCIRLGRLGGRRKSILFFDPPRFFAPEITRSGGSRSDAPTFFAQRDALRAATRNNVAIHVVSTQGLDTELSSPLGLGPRFDALKAMAGMRVLAEETGGEAIVNSNNYAGGFERFVRDTSTYYLLGYTPSVEHRDGEFHSISVRVRRPDLTVRARRGYYGPEPSPPPPQPDPPSVAGLSTDVREALRLPLSANGIGIELFAAPFRNGRTASVVLGAHLHGTDLVLGPGEPLEVGYQAMTNEGTVSPGAFKQITLDLTPSSRATAAAGGVRYLDRIALVPGRHQVRFAVHQANGKTGMVVADVDVPDFSRASVSLSGIVLASQYLTTQPTVLSDGSLKALLGSDPTSVRRFAQGDVLTAYAEVYTSERTRIQDVRVRTTVARVGDTRSTRDIGSRVVIAEPDRTGHVAHLDLSQLSPGDYVLTIEARAGRQRATRQVPFSVER